MPAALLDMLYRSALVAARDHEDTTFLKGCIIKMTDCRNHAMALVWKERVILMHGKGRPLLRRLDKHFVMMQLHVPAPDQTGGNPCQPLIDEQARKGRSLKLHIMAMKQLRLLLDGCTRTVPCGINRLMH